MKRRESKFVAGSARLAPDRIETAAVRPKTETIRTRRKTASSPPPQGAARKRR